MARAEDIAEAKQEIEDLTAGRDKTSSEGQAQHAMLSTKITELMEKAGVFSAVESVEVARNQRASSLMEQLIRKAGLWPQFEAGQARALNPPRTQRSVRGVSDKEESS